MAQLCNLFEYSGDIVSVRSRNVYNCELWDVPCLFTAEGFAGAQFNG